MYAYQNGRNHKLGTTGAVGYGFNVGRPASRAPAAAAAGSRYLADGRAGCLLVGLPALWLHQQQSRHAALVIVENRQAGEPGDDASLDAAPRESRVDVFVGGSASGRSKPGTVSGNIWRKKRVRSGLIWWPSSMKAGTLAQDGLVRLLAEAAARSGIVPNGALLVMGAQIVEAFRIPVAYDGKQAF